MQQSDFETPTDDSNGAGASAPNMDDAASQIAAALDQGDYETAGNLLAEALERFPEDARFLRLAAKQRRQAERFSRVYSLLKETRQAIGDDAFVRALGAFREAANFSQGFTELEAAAFKVAVDEAENLGDRNWRIARTLLEDAAKLSPELRVPEHLLRQIADAEREEIVANVLSETALAKPAELERGRERLLRTLELYPAETGLLARLKSIESTIEEKRKWDERQKCLRRLTDLREALQGEDDPADVAKYVAIGETLAAPYKADPEFGTVLDDIKHQVVSSQRAVEALKQDRIDECLEECAWVLSRMRHHQLFLGIKQKAEERELLLVDEYSSLLSRVKDLMNAGKLDEAEKLCSEARAKLPQFTDLKEISNEIALRKSQRDVNRQHNVESAQRLAERGERSLLDHQFRAAEHSFGNALKLLPDDQKLRGHVLGMLHGYARAIVRENAESAEEALNIAARLLPGRPVPPDLAEALRNNRERAKLESARWSALNALTALDAQAENTNRRDELSGLRREIEKGGFTSAKHPDVREAASALTDKIAEKESLLEGKRRFHPALLKAIPVAAAVVVAVGLAYWLNDRPRPAQPPNPAVAESAATVSPAGDALKEKPAVGSLLLRSDVPGAKVFVNGKQYAISDKPLKIELNPDSYQVKGSRAGFKDFGPVTVAVNKASETVLDLKLAPKPASLEIRGVDAKMRIKVDGDLLAKTSSSRALSGELAPGEHSIEVSKPGYISKTFSRTLTPGDVLVLNRRDLQLESSEARALALRKDRQSGAFATPMIASAKSPAQVPKTDDMQWQAVDKSNPDALRSFIAKNPSSPWTNQARREIEGVLTAREEGEWLGIDHTNRAAVDDFVKRHPSGRYAASAAGVLAEIDRRTRAAEALSAEEATWKKVNQKDPAALESFLRSAATPRYRNQAEVALATIRLSQTSRNESTAVLSVISRFASAWSAKDLDSILSIQRNLNKRTVKAELSQAKEIVMRISPASAPQIDGAQAIVLCRRQASQTFSDGTRKLIPESIVSYVLAKRDGNWTIEGTR